MSRRDWRLLVLVLILGYFAGLFVGIALVGDATFNRAAPTPWRGLLCLPAFVAVWVGYGPGAR